MKSILVLGTGIAGLSAALKFSRCAHVTLVTKVNCEEGATRYAQGGIASVWSKEDSFEKHIQDTLQAGGNLCNPHIVTLCVQEGPERVQELIELGVEFTKKNNEFDLHQEGGHQERRILHSDDLTGWVIEAALLEQVKASPHIQVLEHHIAIDLITENKVLKTQSQLIKNSSGRCLGAYVLNQTTGKIITIPSSITVLATGGAGKVYLYTSNPDTATGDGIAMAFRAGAKIANLEFIQFHPTCLYHPEAKNFLISEALRGEGATLEFMNRYHPMGSLAPRDVVARAIDTEMKRLGKKYVSLDCSAISIENLKQKFPNIYKKCLSFGVDITKQSIPVVPAAHYTCGGVLVDEYGQTTVPGLYAIGEVACTGVHGANRLASNSLLEAVVFAHRAVQHALASTLHLKAPEISEVSHLPEWDSGQAIEVEEQMDIASSWLEIRSLMWNYVGIVRSNQKLEKAQRRLSLLKSEIKNYYWKFILTKDLIELRNLLTTAELIVECALLRKESRGLHYNKDYPKQNDSDFCRDTVI